jgi:hypothetical protein
LIADLKEPNDWSCLMLKTPLKLVTRSYTTALFMWFLMIFVYGNLVLLYFPSKLAQSANTSFSLFERERIDNFSTKFFRSDSVIPPASNVQQLRQHPEALGHIVY